MIVQHSLNKHNKIQVKIGGDHGGGSFKLSYQIANVFYSNSTDSSVVFSISEAKDYRSIVKIGLSRLREQINTLQTIKWRCVMPLFLGERNYQKNTTSKLNAY